MMYYTRTSLQHLIPYKTSKNTGNNTCEIPVLNIWDKVVKDRLKPIPVFTCKKHSPLTYISEGKLYIDPEIRSKYYTGIKNCKMARVDRETSKKDSYSVGKFEIFTDGVQINDNVISVKCYDDKMILKYGYVHDIIHRIEKTKNILESKTKLNVLILIFDSVSASSFKRALPKTFDYLKTFANFYHFEKLHTVGQNTIPNIGPMLSGLKHELLLGKETIPPPFDNFPFIWKQFSKNNYVTYFNEDWRKSMFNNEKFGFKESPTDYYLKPYWLAVYDSMSSEPNKANSNKVPCYYDKLYHMLHLNWLRRLLNEYSPSSDPSTKIDQNLFGIVKVNEMSHDVLERLFWIDDDLLSLFKDIFTESFLDNTLLLVMGDHGHRFHSIRSTFIGKLEERLPFLGMMLPKKLHNKYPSLDGILKQNTKNLITFWDIYETLNHLLLDQLEMKLISNNETLPTTNYLKDKMIREKNSDKDRPVAGYSLFLPVPLRDCNEAFIPEFLCLCGINPTLGADHLNNEAIFNAAKFMVNYINNKILKNQNMCIKREFLRIKSAKNVGNSALDKFSIIIEVSPDNAVFDGLVKMTKIRSEKTFRVIGQISRISLYGDTANCIEDNYLKNYCFCK